jgi:hypothetical protein
MMIPTISDYLFHVHHFKLELLSEIRKKRAIRLICVFAVILTGSVLIWILY